MKRRAASNTYDPVPVAMAEKVGHQHGKEVVVILAFDQSENRTDVVTWGKMAVSKETARRWGEVAAKAIGCDMSSVDVHEDFHADFNPAVQKEAIDILTALKANKRCPVNVRKRIERLLLLAAALQGKK